MRSVWIVACSMLAACPGGVPTRPELAASGPKLPPPRSIDPSVRGAVYLTAVAERLQPQWAQFLEDCRLRLPGSHPLNRSSLVAIADLAIARDGRVLVRITTSSGNGDFDTAVFDVASDAAGATRPAVTGITPATAATGVPRDSGIAATVSLPNVGEGVDQNTLDATSVQLVRASDQATVPANLNTSGGGDIIVIQPTVLLDPNTKYVVRITDDVHDTSGAGFLPFTSTFVSI